MEVVPEEALLAVTFRAEALVDESTLRPQVLDIVGAICSQDQINDKLAEVLTKPRY
jgi:hypothetical protein